MNGAYVTWNKSWLLSKNTTRHCEMDGIGENGSMAENLFEQKQKPRKKKLNENKQQEMYDG